MRTVTTFEAVKLSTNKTFRSCTVCGRPGKRQKTFRQTINPFNKNADGQPKTRHEIWNELQCLAVTWQPNVHAQCES